MSGGAIAGAVAAAAISAGAGALSASSGRKASKKAMQAEAEAFNASILKQLEMYNLSAAELKNAMQLVEQYQLSAREQIAKNQAPYQAIGSVGLAGMNYTMGKSQIHPPKETPGAKRYKQATSDFEKLNAEIEAAKKSGKYDENAFQPRIDAAKAAIEKARGQTPKEAARYDQYKQDVIGYQQALQKEKEDPAFGAATKSYQETTGDKYPEFVPFDKEIPQFKAFDKEIPTWTPTTIEDMKADPGYQFRFQQGQEAVENSAAAKGSLLGGNTLRALNEYGQGFASNEFGNVNQRRQQDYLNKSGEWDTGYQKNTADWQSRLADWGSNYKKYMGDYDAQTGSYINKYNMFNQDRDNPFNKYLTLMGVGQEANRNVNDATTHLYDSLSGNVSNYARNMAILNQNLADSYSGNRQGVGQAQSNNATNQGNISSWLNSGLADTAGTLINQLPLEEIFARFSQKPQNTGANPQLQNAVTKSTSGLFNNLFK